VSGQADGGGDCALEDVEEEIRWVRCVPDTRTQQATQQRDPLLLLLLLLLLPYRENPPMCRLLPY
jgi:hypothetical protein